MNYKKANVTQQEEETIPDPLEHDMERFVQQYFKTPKQMMVNETTKTKLKKNIESLPIQLSIIMAGFGNDNKKLKALDHEKSQSNQEYNVTCQEEDTTMTPVRQQKVQEAQETIPFHEKLHESQGHTY